MSISRISILGLGLIGGSLAKAFKRTNPDFIITGMDSNENNINSALQEGMVDAVASSIEELLRDSQVVFLCTPIHVIPNLINTISKLAYPGTLITDVGSTKEEIMRIAEEVFPPDIHFIGGHPMAGNERSGYQASSAHLFENAYYLLTPLPTTPTAAIETLTSLIESTGAISLVVDPSLHDQMVGAISHLPHVVAAALVNTVNGLDDPFSHLQKLAAGGFKDITRIASSNPSMWKNISLANKQQLLPLITSMIHRLYYFGILLEKGDSDRIEAFYHKAKAFRDQMPSHQNLILLPYYQLYIDVEDKPGIIGKATTLLGEHGINIKNIRIINSREDDPGCLVLSLPNQQNQLDALKLLVENSYRAYIR